MEASVFIATSLDGFIARSDGRLDWLPEGGGEPHGYTEFMATVDALVLGRTTYDKVLSCDAWPGLLRAASGTSTSMAGSRFSGFSRPGSFSGSLSRACPC